MEELTITDETQNELVFDSSLMSDGTLYVEISIHHTDSCSCISLSKDDAINLINHLKQQFGI